MKHTIKPTPDLLGDVVALLEPLNNHELNGVAAACEVSVPTLKNIRDSRPGRLGPSYSVIVKLHRILQERLVEKTG